jgi:phage/plasmid-like protein (TIGR03299 family)
MHNVETMFYSRETPWHGLGTRVEEALTSSEAIEKAGLDWEVNPMPMFININGKPVEVPNVVANVRSSDNSVLGTVTDRYKIVQNKEAFAFTDALLTNKDIPVKYETAGSLQNGKKVWMLANMPESEIVGEKYEVHLVFYTSHDGKGAIKVACTPVRCVCQNTVNLAIKNASRIWTTKHMGNMESKLAEAYRTLNLATDYITNLQREAEILADQKFSGSDVDSFIERLIPIAKDACDRNKLNLTDMREELKDRWAMAPDLASIRDSKWGMIQAVSDFATHRVPKRLTDTYKESLFDEVIQGHDMIDTAYSLLSA